MGTADSVVTADYDVDGFLDLFVTNGFNLQPRYIGGPNKLFHNNGNANHWIELDLIGVNSDRDATGARVYATANGVTQLRVQDGRYHRWSQDAKRLHFGLAGATSVSLSVKWPNGAIQTFADVPANRLYQLTEGASNPVPVVLKVPASPPTGLTATAGNASVQLAWAAVPGATSYNVYQGTTAGGEGAMAVMSAITTTTANVTPLAKRDDLLLRGQRRHRGGGERPFERGVGHAGGAVRWWRRWRRRRRRCPGFLVAPGNCGSRRPEAAKAGLSRAIAGKRWKQLIL